MPSVLSPLSLVLSQAGANALAYAGGSAIGRWLGTDFLLALCIALVLALASLLLVLADASRKATLAEHLTQRRAARVEELLCMTRLMERAADIGIWEYDLSNGSHRWSEGMRRIFGVGRNEPMLEGDAETLFFCNQINLVEEAHARRDHHEPYTLEFEIDGGDGEMRTLHVEARNLERGEDDRDRVVAIFRDMTKQVLRERQLEHSRAAAIEEATRARQLAETDPLTGLANRRSVLNRLDRLIAESRNSTTPLAVIIFDIDHFKGVNDTYGHVEGDKVLQNVARIAQAQSRDGDVVGRIGGEEFVMIVPGAGESVARVMSERLRVAVSQESATDAVPAVTLSAGVADLCPGDTSLSLFARADAALYEAKNAGRNRVKLAA